MSRVNAGAGVKHTDKEKQQRKKDGERERKQCNREYTNKDREKMR